jgi:Fe-S-cluster containining protein
MEADKDNVKMLANRNQEETRTFFTKLKRKKPKNLDTVTHRIHDQVIANFDCLQCANCCALISPMITDKDIDRIARFLKMKPVDFVERYLHIDEDQCYVFSNIPCPFLMQDNYCIIYDQRPKACREYPHTDRRRFYQILNLTMKNRDICPIVYEVVEKLKQENL